MSTTKHIAMEEFRINLAEMVLRVRYKNERYVIEKRGVPIALVIPFENIHTPAPPPDARPSTPELPQSSLSNLKVFETVR